MAFDTQTIAHMENKWLETRLRYEGWGRAEFADPEGTVEGPTKVRFDASGQARVILYIERIESTIPGHFVFHKGSGTIQDFKRHGGFNPCRKLTVQTADGLFTADERIISSDAPMIPGQNRLHLRPIRSTFEVTASAVAKYWVLPLSNFVVDYWTSPAEYRELSGHPLRIVPIPQIPSGLSPEDERQAKRLALRNNRLFTFLMKGLPGFIEQLPMYTQRVNCLRRKKRANLLTAIIVGPAHVQSVRFSDYEQIFPLDVLSLLSFATGVRVGAPWIEFRDQEGKLVRRIHISFGAPSYSEGHAALFHPAENAVGYLLTCAFDSPNIGKSYLRAVTNHAIEVSMRTHTLEGLFVELCRGFETLFRHHKLGTQNLLGSMNSSQQQTVTAGLETLAAQFRAIAKAETDSTRKGALDRVASRVQSAAAKENSFGLAIVELLKEFNLPDSQIIDQHLATKPISGAASWAGLLSCFRGAPIHEGYFDLPSGRHDLLDILTIRDHLHDLLIRILLKTLCYEGPYRPPIPPRIPRDSVDWVTTATAPAELGYG